MRSQSCSVLACHAMRSQSCSVLACHAMRSQSCSVLACHAMRSQSCSVLEGHALLPCVCCGCTQGDGPAQVLIPDSGAVARQRAVPWQWLSAGARAYTRSCKLGRSQAHTHGCQEASAARSRPPTCHQAAEVRRSTHLAGVNGWRIDDGWNSAASAT